MRDSAGVASCSSVGTPPAGVAGSRSRSPKDGGSARYGEVTHGCRINAVCFTSGSRSCGRVVRVDAIAAEFVLNQRAFVLGVDVRRRDQRGVEAKKRFDSPFNVSTYSLGISTACQTRAAYLAEAPRTRATRETVVHRDLSSVSSSSRARCSRCGQLCLRMRSVFAWTPGSAALSQSPARL